MEVLVVDHPLVAERLTKIRQTATTNAEFRKNLHEASLFLIYEALQEISLTEKHVETPLADTRGHMVTELPVFVPILRAGLGMLDAALILCPDSCVAFVGAKRDEETLQPDIYLNTIPENLNGSMVVLLDPALATGGSMIQALELVEAAGAGEMIIVTLLASPEGIQALGKRGLGTKVVTAAVDERLNDIGFIYPGLGDAGDRQYGID
ncbi:MAG: uracil phosphoribosyltransferase [Acidimicrobiaceae bacterium]|nr:uracil phosphoribosyltransferase [Acidimicrobiaceae bacterium]|tara:strand:- start:908 stop:1531 length:624 start_codon:yes stop_codon:yes gene_type:complete